MKTNLLPSIAVAGALCVAASAGAQQTTHPAPKSDIPSALAHSARITLDSARNVARAKLPKAWVQSEELERENGRLIYSFDMKTDRKSGIDEVNVNALNGSIVGKVGHESPKSEAKEAAAEHETLPKKPA